MSIKLSDKAEARLKEKIALYPDPKSAAMWALYIAQEELGRLDDRAVEWTAERLNLSPVNVQELITFYTMYHKEQLGKYHVQICRTLSCAVRGSTKLTECVRKRFGTKPGQPSADGMWSYEEVECLGSCGTAPMCQINDHFFENLTPQKLTEILDRIEKEKPDLKLSTIDDRMGEGLKGYPKSQII
ncbi:MAG: NAD(P)H-dependent oxidoreductase subunit E [Oligoflexia bacterium]|nr:NAD(P)H-dependent oxidoreductase subunit E [Oligoflexia bacterium]